MIRYVVMCILYGVLFFAMDDVYAVDFDDDDGNYHLNIKDIIVQKSGINNNVQIDGKIPHLNANMTLMSPDGVIENSILTVTKNGQVSGFISLDDESTSGLYLVNIISYNDTATYDKELYFFLSDYDGMVDITIQRNAAIACSGDDNDNSLTLSDECVSPAKTHIPKTFGLRFFNSDYKNHQFDVGGIKSDPILSAGDGVVYPQKTGSYDYFCIIHPWIGGSITVTDIKSLRFSVSSITDDITAIPADSILLNRTGITYDDSCSMCYVGVVTKIIDGDTIYIDKKSVRLSLVDTPEKKDIGFDDATEHTRQTCPVGIRALVNLDDLQPRDRFGRQIAKITCGDTNLNASLLESGHARLFKVFCGNSEFANESWTSCVSDVLIPEPQSNKMNHTSTNSVLSQNAITIVASNETLENADYKIFIFLIVVIILVVTCLIFYLKKSTTHTTSKDSPIWEYLE